MRATRARLRRAAAAAFACGLLAPTVSAHLVQTGFGAFYDGIVHLGITPTDLLVVIAVGLYAGQRGKRAARGVIVALPLCWFAGGLAGTRLEGVEGLPLATAASVLLAGVLLAADARLPHAAVLALGAALGLLHGLVNGATMTTGGSTLLGLAGAAVMVFCIVTLLSAGVVELRAGWARIAVRVAGSWIGAVAVLTLGWLASDR